MFWKKIHVKATYSKVTNKTNHKTSYFGGRRSYIGTFKESSNVNVVYLFKWAEKTSLYIRTVSF